MSYLNFKLNYLTFNKMWVQFINPSSIKLINSLKMSYLIFKLNYLTSFFSWLLVQNVGAIP